jgi:hypothetical protein
MLKKALCGYEIGGWLGLLVATRNYIRRLLGNIFDSSSVSNLQVSNEGYVQSADTHQRKIVLVSYGAQPHGVQYLALSMAK